MKFKLTLAVVVVALMVIFFLGDKMVETNDAGFVQVKQAAVSGEMTVITEPGMYAQNWGDITTYKIADDIPFVIQVRFKDAATADIKGHIKYRIPTAHEKVLRIHEEFRGADNLKMVLMEKELLEAMQQSANHFGAEEVYSTRRSDFINLINKQLEDGLYKTTYSEVVGMDTDGNKKVERHIKIKYDKDKNPIIMEPSALAAYGIEVIQLIIEDPDFDERTDNLIAERKEAEQQEIVARANARKAKQDTITTEERGKAQVAKARYDALVVKETAVIEAQKQKEVAIENALKAIEDKKKLIAIGEGEAEAARLKVAAGLSPLEEATIDKETAIGVAEKLAQVKFPKMMVIGGGGNDSPLNPFDAVGLQSFIDISKKMSDTKN